jgi:trimethylamine--corrinoid protein Co-methyltransferase
MTRRRARNRSPASDSVVKPKAQQLFNPYEPIAALDPESLDLIHDASMRILEDIGLEILNGENRERAVGIYPACAESRA